MQFHYTGTTKMVFPSLHATGIIGVLVCDPGDIVELDDDPVSPWFSTDSAAEGPQPVAAATPSVSPTPGDVAAPPVPVQAPPPDGTGGDGRDPADDPQEPATGSESGSGDNPPTDPTDTPTTGETAK